MISKYLIIKTIREKRVHVLFVQHVKIYLSYIIFHGFLIIEILIKILIFIKI